MVEAICLGWSTHYEHHPDDVIVIYKKDAEHDFCVSRPHKERIGQSEWYIFPRFFNGDKPLASISGKGFSSLEDFMLSLLEQYPEDFEWFLWHPEVLHREWNP